MNENTIAGKMIVINETQHFQSGFQKREFVIETDDEKYPQKLKFEVVKEGCDRLDAYQIGDDIAVCYNLRGNEYNGKYYVSLLAWRIGKIGSAPQPVTTRSPSQNGARPPAPQPESDEFDEIPF